MTGLNSTALPETCRVDNAIIMAAGMSCRFAPLSYEKPKGLLKVKGEVLIEREIRQLHKAGITDITVVVGYMKEKFFYLQEKFGVKIVINEDYYRYNNPSTLIKVLDKLGNTYICSCDNYFVENVFEAEVPRAYYAAVYAEGETGEYCLTTNDDGRIIDVTIGGHDSWYMLGHVYFDRAFSEKFVEILQKEYEEAKEQLWENLYMKYIDELEMYVRKYDADKILEFDTLDELRSFDPEYVDNIDSKILQNICKVLGCSIKEIIDIQNTKIGFVKSFKFSVRGTDYIYVHYKEETDGYINKESKDLLVNALSCLELDDTFAYMDNWEGWRILRLAANVIDDDFHNDSEKD